MQRFLVALAVSLPLAAPAQENSETKIPIAVFVSGISAFTQPALTAIQQDFAQRVAFTIFDNHFDPQLQASQCQEAIATKKFKGFVIYATDGAAMVPCVKTAGAAGIKVAGWNFPPIGPDPLSEAIQVPGLVGIDLLSSKVDVKAAVSMTLKACAGRDPCNVAMLIAEPKVAHSTIKHREELEAFKKHRNIHVVAEHVIGFNASGKAEAAIQADLQKGLDLHVVLGDDDVGLAGAERARDKAGKTRDIQLIGDGATVAGVRAVAEGRWFGTVVVLPATGARTATQMVVDAIDGKPIKQRVVINQLEQKACPNAQIVQACASQFKAEW